MNNNKKIFLSENFFLQKLTLRSQNFRVLRVELSRECPGKIPEVSWKVPGHLPVFRMCPGKCPEVYRN